jgi:hypothetical protein
MPVAKLLSVPPYEPAYAASRLPPPRLFGFYVSWKIKRLQRVERAGPAFEEGRRVGSVGTPAGGSRRSVFHRLRPPAAANATARPDRSRVEDSVRARCPQTCRNLRRNCPQHITPRCTIEELEALATPKRVALAYTPDSEWRNRVEFLHGREEINSLPAPQVAKGARLPAQEALWRWNENRIAVTFEYE